MSTLHRTAPTVAMNFPPDALYETWESIYDKSLELGDMIEAHCLETDERFDKIVVVPRGGYYPANILTREFGFTAPVLLHACLGSYSLGATVRNREFEYGQMPTKEEVEDQNLLIVEEVCDTGHTLKHLIDLLQLAGAGLIRSAALHYKPDRTETGVIPDWYVMKTGRWIVYPWEFNEQRGKLSVVRSRLDTTGVKKGIPNS